MRSAPSPMPSCWPARSAQRCDRLGLSETGATGPTGNRYGDAAGHSCIAVAGPRTTSSRWRPAAPTGGQHAGFAAGARICCWRICRSEDEFAGTAKRDFGAHPLVPLKNRWARYALPTLQERPSRIASCNNSTAPPKISATRRSRARQRHGPRPAAGDAVLHQRAGADARPLSDGRSTTCGSTSAAASFICRPESRRCCAAMPASCCPTARRCSSGWRSVKEAASGHALRIQRARTTTSRRSARGATASAATSPTRRASGACSSACRTSSSTCRRHRDGNRALLSAGHRDVGRRR